MPGMTVEQVKHRIPRCARCAITRGQNYVVRKSRVDELAMELDRFDRWYRTARGSEQVCGRPDCDADQRRQHYEHRELQASREKECKEVLSFHFNQERPIVYFQPGRYRSRFCISPIHA